MLRMVKKSTLDAETEEEHTQQWSERVRKSGGDLPTQGYGAVPTTI